MDSGTLPPHEYALKRAQDCLLAMRSAKHLGELASRWEEYLIAHQRVWNKTEAQFKTQPWWPRIKSKFVAERASDQLLVYLQQARHADEHGIAPISTRTAEGVGISGSGRIRHLRIGPGMQVSGDFDPGIRVQFVPATVVAVPVVNRGVRYLPPVLGHDAAGPPVLVLADNGLAFYDRLFEVLRTACTKP